VSKSQNRPDNWLFSTRDGKFGGVLINTPRAAVVDLALTALAASAEHTYGDTDILFSRYGGSSLFFAYAPEATGEFADIVLADEGTTENLYRLAGWEVPEKDDDDDDDSEDDDDSSDDSDDDDDDDDDDDEDYDDEENLSAAEKLEQAKARALSGRAARRAKPRTGY
jgi:hypothetical protein